ncbi:hypothetical protein QRD38_02745 [Leptospira weilii]|uniref:hypothetical protein n=1 Tax=Leptospira weilii TaxID=28184 RepID=UPI00256EB444|nr:hypothetical protein [Leptospira weilii]MDL5244727.1 hypothetical protein [Leptospira weilii]
MSKEYIYSFKSKFGEIFYELYDFDLKTAVARVPSGGRLLTNAELDFLLRDDPSQEIYKFVGFKARTNLLIAFEEHNKPFEETLNARQFLSSIPQPILTKCIVPKEFVGKKNMGLVFEMPDSSLDWKTGELRGKVVHAFPVPFETGEYYECDKKFILPTTGEKGSDQNPNARQIFFNNSSAFIGSVEYGRGGHSFQFSGPGSITGAAWLMPI